MALMLYHLGVERQLLPSGVIDMVQSIDQNVGVAVRSKMINLSNVRLANDELFLNQRLGKEDANALKCKGPPHSHHHAPGTGLGRVLFSKNDPILGLVIGCLMPKIGIDREKHGLMAIFIKSVENYTFHNVQFEEDADSGIDQGFQA